MAKSFMSPVYGAIYTESVKDQQYKKHRRATGKPCLHSNTYWGYFYMSEEFSFLLWNDCGNSVSKISNGKKKVT